MIGFDNGYIGDIWRVQFVADAQRQAKKLGAKGLII